MSRFVGRKNELEYLTQLLNKRSASAVVIRGRRRIGKSRLIQEFSKAFPKSYLFTGIPPTDEADKQSQIDLFCRQLARNFGSLPFKASTWDEVFWQLSQLVDKGRVLLALDEISWMGSKAPDFLGHLKTAWDLYFSKNDKLILIICGSVSSWIKKNILNSSGFVGRVSVDMHLEELLIHEAAQFWGKRQSRISPMEILKVLMVTGGVPRYLEEVRSELSAEENIRLMCFEKKGLLYREFDQIFSDLFSKMASSYAEIATALATGSKQLADIATLLKIPPSTVLLHSRDLVQAGFVAEDPTWNLSTMKASRFKQYRLSDNYVRFYLRYILPQKESIDQGLAGSISLAHLPQWGVMLGLQFENLVLRNAHLIFAALKLDPAEVEKYGPYFQRPSKRQKGCQIDLLIQTRHRTIYLCEVKFTKDRIGLATAHEMDAKQQRISTPRGWSKRLVLIHVNGTSDEVYQADFFDHIVDFAELLQQKS